MSDYTPTTEEVRRRYMFGCWQEHEDTSGDYKPELDRWVVEIRKEERERAIKIIDKATLHYGKTHSASTACRICEMLFAIEGEDA